MRFYPHPHISFTGLALTTHWSCSQAPVCTDHSGDIFLETGGAVEYLELYTRTASNTIDLASVAGELGHKGCALKKRSIKGEISI